MAGPLIPVPQVPPLPGLPAIPLPEEAKRIRPDILIITLLDDLHITLQESQSLLSKMRDFLKNIEAHMERVPQGVVETYDSLTVTSTEQTFDTIAQTEQKWFSATIYNKGPDSVQVRVNDGLPSETASLRTARKSRYVTLAEGESVDIDFHVPLIRYIYYKLASGGAAASIKIVGEW